MMPKPLGFSYNIMTPFINIAERKLAVIGLGYVGLPLAVEFGKQRPVMGFDLNSIRIAELKQGHDATLEISSSELQEAALLYFATTLSDIAFCDTFIITVPTPIDRYKQPDFTYLVHASEMLAPLLKQNDIVIYESTVYPGAIEEICVPILEQYSTLQFNQDFFVGYSPERINPGDKIHRLTKIKKITSGSTPEVADIVDTLYQQIVTAGTHKVSSIRVAEAAKVIENTQRDLNIALINELAMIFNKLGIDTEEVLQAAETKWNFLPFRPGLVGGHCIGVDPYYLTHKAEAIGYHPEIILAGRRINDEMGHYVASQLVKEMLKRRIHVDGARILIMGLTFKENCPDLRNTRVIDIISELRSYNATIDVYDPWVNPAAAEGEYKLTVLEHPPSDTYDAIVLAVAHNQFKELGELEIRAFGKKAHVLYDLKYLLPQHASDIRL
ncbi:MAG: Vi polysaccharide biosynthesis UDP-N-acetylglucosamine C-6 dehydrogenase TviB [Legionellaceae bacterium]|nr:Vi polysaccharide biosynthesis UDP-N-acetylglucosamine C-6 dehydrogenase TviB [Legionellaceae bacterium]